jgi:hypothetical protein
MLVSAQREHGQLVGAGCAAEAEVDPPGMQPGERPELLRDHERCMVREHDPAGADADRAGTGGTCAITTAVAALAMPAAL